ncbi:hypothetical protein ABZX99_24960 [Streptomyces antibioticus]|uniref:hypothetical protein n=1 Tax=Streptomyces TaxID=1883 RepID=UPI001587CFA2|nr:hypothetical protein [Streptomyces sp. CAI-85]NUV58180.1 hypothetical protein [Streptomyces sp. CAI-85]
MTTFPRRTVPTYTADGSEQVAELLAAERAVRSESPTPGEYFAVVTVVSTDTVGELAAADPLMDAQRTLLAEHRRWHAADDAFRIWARDPRPAIRRETAYEAERARAAEERAADRSPAALFTLPRHLLIVTELILVLTEFLFWLNAFTFGDATGGLDLRGYALAAVIPVSSVLAVRVAGALCRPFAARLGSSGGDGATRPRPSPVGPAAALLVALGLIAVTCLLTAQRLDGSSAFTAFGDLSPSGPLVALVFAGLLLADLLARIFGRERNRDAVETARDKEVRADDSREHRLRGDWRNARTAYEEAGIELDRLVNDLMVTAVGSRAAAAALILAERSRHKPPVSGEEDSGLSASSHPDGDPGLHIAGLDVPEVAFRHVRAARALRARLEAELPRALPPQGAGGAGGTGGTEDTRTPDDGFGSDR